MKNPVFWLFCTVIDNFGDIGVAWRLARELRIRLNARVYLWLDDFTALQTIAPNWQQEEIEVLIWQEGQVIDLQDIELPNVVIETFACTLPENVLHIIEQTGVTWLNWEYLSAEDWAVRTHLMPSLQHNGATKCFWQMGFLPETGGLLREADYAEKQQNFFRQPENQQFVGRALMPDAPCCNHVGHECPTYANQVASSIFRQPETANLPENRALTIFIFAYDSPIWTKWAHAWQQLGQAITLKIASNQVIQALKRDGFLFENALQDDKPFVSGSLKIEKLDFVPQSKFDTRLWAADILIIRGEDSFVRAQFAGKPFFWHIYSQDQMAHLDKLDAFWRLPRTVFSQEKFQAAFDGLSGDLNGAHILSEQECMAQWAVLLEYFSDWQIQAHLWQQFLLTQTDTVSRLADFLQLEVSA
ncbi:elongation factor P maturation arginine rhamnosyltransferase EarP [Neisseriaceae bacterium B1]